MRRNGERAKANERNPASNRAQPTPVGRYHFTSAAASMSLIEFPAKKVVSNDALQLWRTLQWKSSELTSTDTSVFSPSIPVAPAQL